jgi:hypothetical protein
MSLDKLIESRIQEAAAAGAFKGLEGEGKPLAIDSADNLGDNWMGYRILRNGGALPPWLALAREIEDDGKRLDAAAARYTEFVRLAAASGDWRRHAPAIGRLRERFLESARDLKKKQDRYNADAPKLSLERPAIWIEYRVEQLDRDLRDAGAPEGLFPWLRGSCAES